MQEHRPHGRAVSTLEANILKLRALEMVLMIFYVESLKRFITASVKATRYINKTSGRPQYTTNDVKNFGFKKACEILNSEGVLTQEEILELKGLNDYRNMIAHEVHRMTLDIGKYSHVASYELTEGKKIGRYDHSAVRDIKKITEKVKQKMSERNFCFSLSFDELAFDSAEKTYLKEIARLKRKVVNGIKSMNETIMATNEAITNIPRAILDEVQPCHPKNTKANGTFSPEGIKGIYMLYDANATPLAVSYIMRISYRTASKWHKKWVENQIV